MDGHVHAALRRRGDDSLQEVFQIRPQVLLCQSLILSHHIPQLLPGVAGVPARQSQIAVTLQRVYLIHLLLIVHQGGGAVGQHMVQLGAGPVEHRHKVVADALHISLCQPADILAVILDVLIPAGLAQLDVLVNGNTFNHLKLQAGGFCQSLQTGNALPAPHLAHRHVVHSGDNGFHAGNLPDLLQCDLVLFTIPAKR